MERINKIILWVIGFCVLILLLRFPIKPVDPTWNTWSLPLSGKVIVIDPGHGGPDGGAVASDQTEEKDIALSVSKKLRDYLQQVGGIIYMTREEDKDLAHKDTKGLSRRKSEDIRNRLAFIHEKQADLFVSIHLNATPSPRWRGAQTFYAPHLDENKHLAEMIQAEFIRNLENTDRSALMINSVYLLKHAEIPGALVEVGFLSNEQERELLKLDRYQSQVAGSIYLGILRYLTEEPSNNE